MNNMYTLIPSPFLRCLYEGMMAIQDGLELYTPDSEAPVLVKAVVLCGTCDLPAKCGALNMVQFNTSYGCPKCKQKGQTIHFEEGNKGHTHCYLFQPEDVDGPKRTNSEMNELARQAVERDAPVFGIKGPSILNYVVPNIIYSTAVDSMHCVYLGVSKKLLSLWFDSKYHSKPYSLRKNRAWVDSVLTSLTPPPFFQRGPRSLDELPYWKASEFKYWLFYYSSPILKEVMPDDLFKHHDLLVSAVRLLYQSSISPEDVNKAEKMLWEYVLFEILYNRQFMTINFHSLIHLAECVRQLGPLWESSCFAFENMNARLLKLIHGTRHPQLQIASSFGFFLSIEGYLQSLDDESETKLFCRKMLSRQKVFKESDRISQNAVVIGGFSHPEVISYDTQLALLDQEDEPFEECLFFYRIKIFNTVYYSKAYAEKMQNRLGYYLTFSENGEQMKFGEIQHYIKCRNDHNSTYYALLKECEVEGSPSTNFLKITRINLHTTAISIDSIKNMLLFLDISGEKYLVPLLSEES